MTAPLRILYFGLNAPDKSMRDVPYIAGLKRLGATFEVCYDTSRGFRKYFALMKKMLPLRGQFDVVWVGHSSALAVPLIRLLTRKPIVFNALCPQYDGNVVDRGTYSPLSPYAIFIWCIDFVSLNAAHALLLETDAQIENVRRTFFVPRRKMHRVFTTVDPALYHPDPSIQKENACTCVFRAWVTRATGAEYILDAARILKGSGVNFRFIVRGPMVPEIEARVAGEKLSHVQVLTGFHETGDLNRLILSGHIYLGQFSDHIRTSRTIQFKTVEALAYGLPYITADLPSNRELLTDKKECLFVKPRSAEDLAEKILMLKNDSVFAARLAKAGHELYQKKLTPDVLANQILSIIRGLV